MKRLLIFIFTSALFIAGTISLSGGQDISGEWQGPLTTGMGELRLVLHITKTADGSLKATMDSPDQGIGGIPVDSINADGGKVHFVVNVIKGNFDGALKGNGTIAGNWTQAASGTNKMQLLLNKTTTPIKLTHDPAPPSDIDGTWEGSVDSPASGKLRIVFHIQNTADGLVVKMDSPDQNLKGWPATTVTRKGSSVKFAMAQVSGTFQGKVSKGLDTISGDWSQGPENLPLILKKAKDDSANAQKTDAQKK
jgi:hypothetical protein